MNKKLADRINRAAHKVAVAAQMLSTYAEELSEPDGQLDNTSRRLAAADYTRALRTYNKAQQRLKKLLDDEPSWRTIAQRQLVRMKSK